MTARRWGGGYLLDPDNVSTIAPTDGQLMVFNNTTKLWQPVALSGDLTIDNTGKASLAAGPFAFATGSVNVNAASIGSFSVRGTAATLPNPSRAVTLLAICTVQCYPLAATKDTDFLIDISISTDGGTTFAGSQGSPKGHSDSSIGGFNLVAGVASLVTMAIRNNVTPTGAISTKLQIEQTANASGDFNYAGQTILMQFPPG